MAEQRLLSMLLKLLHFGIYATLYLSKLVMIALGQIRRTLRFKFLRYQNQLFQMSEKQDQVYQAIIKKFIDNINPISCASTSPQAKQISEDLIVMKFLSEIGYYKNQQNETKLKVIEHVALIVNNLREGPVSENNQVQWDPIWLLQKLAKYSFFDFLFDQKKNVFDVETAVDSIANILFWFSLISDLKVITIYDQKGLLKDKKYIDQIINRSNLRRGSIFEMKLIKEGSITISINSMQSKELTVHFISQEDDPIYKMVELRADSMKEKEKIDDYSNYEKNLYDIYFERNNPKIIEKNLPEVVFVFNSSKRVIQMDGFPCLYKEVAEIFECGRIQKQRFRPIEFIELIEKYAAIEQRQGL